MGDSTLAFRASAAIGAGVAIAIPAPAFADANPPAVSVTTMEASDAQPTSSAGTGASDQDEQIVVTARRRTETAQKVPIAISVVRGDHIDNTGAFNVGRLQQLTPTVQFYSSNARNSGVNIRGIGVPFGLTNDGIEQGVGIYVDDVYYSRAASATFDFLDVDRIEVLRGPQGTLYGKNTTAGAINITTRAPTFNFEARAEASIGNLGFEQVKAAVSGPLSGKVAVRVAMSATTRDGTLLNVHTGHRINEQDNLGFRGQLLWKPSDDLEVTLAGDYSRQNPECCGMVYVRTGATQRPLNRQYDALAAALGYSAPSTNAFDRLADLDSELKAKNSLWGISARFKWNLGQGTLTAVSAWRHWDWDPASDRDFIGLPITTKSQNPSQQNQYTQELRYNRAGHAIDINAGAFAFYQTIRTQGLQVQGPAASRFLLNPGNVPTGSSICAPPTANACNPAVLNGLTATNDIRLNNTSVALFGQLAWHATDALTIQPGARLNYDRKTGLYDSVVTDSAGKLVVFGPTDSVTRDRLSVLAPQHFEPRYRAWNFSYDLTTSYRLSHDINIYATYARTFKSGGVNLNGVPNDNAGNPLLAAATVKPERVRHFEAGLKSQFLGRRVTFNLAAFRTEIRDFQVLVNNGQLGVLRGYLANAGKVRAQGVEWDVSARLSPRFNAYFNGAYTDAKYMKFVDAPCPPELSGGTVATGTQVPSAPGTPGGISPASCDVSGERLPGVSKWSASYGAEANVPATIFGHAGQVYLGFDGFYRSRFSSNPTPSVYAWIKGYALSNFRVGFRTSKSVDLFAWVRNAFDARYFEQLSIQSGNTGLIVGQPGDPRTWGGTIRLRM
jgi:iron complex outermembrane recepter protein